MSLGVSLVEACKQGDPNRVRSILDSARSTRELDDVLSHHDDNGRTALLVACAAGGPSLLPTRPTHEMLDTINREQVQRHHEQALRLSTCEERDRGFIECVRLLLEYRAKVNEDRDADERSCMHIAATAPSSVSNAIVELLIEHQAEVNVTDLDEQTALHWAARANNAATASSLLAHDASLIDAVDSCGYTALHEAAMEGSELVARVLLDARASIDARDLELETPLMFAILHGHGNVASLLIESRADVNATDEDQRTALHCAAVGGGDGSLVSVLLDARAELDARDSKLRTPLHVASIKGEKLVVSALVGARANVEAIDRYGYRAIHWATISNGGGNLDVLASLVHEGHARVDTPCGTIAASPIDLALSHPTKNLTCILTLLDLGSKPATLQSNQLLSEYLALNYRGML